jgi:PKD repeat protein
MKPRITLLLLALLSMVGLSAQNYCGFDAFQNHLKLGSHYHSQLNQHDSLIRQSVQSGELRGGGAIYTIPTVVHVIHNGGAENISEETVENAIEWLNDAYSNQGYYEYADGVDVQIRFCLAHVDEDGNYHSGVNYVQSDLTTVTVPTQDQELKDLSRWDTELYLNIWVVGSLIREVDQEGIIGNSTLPTSHGADNDGIIVEAAFFGGSENQNKVLVHETGHYLGLYHTFEGGCQNDDCLLNGDRVCDTPPDSQSSGLCAGSINSCSTDEDDENDYNPFRPVSLGGLGDQLDMVINYMDYSTLSCYEQFSEGQADRMVASLTIIRASLLEGDRCNTPCEVPIEANVSVSALEIPLGDNVLFVNTSSNYTDATWYIDEVIIAVSDNFEFTPLEEGEYFVEVLLGNSDQGCAIELEWTISVLCPVFPSFTSSANNVGLNEVVEFVNTSEEAEIYKWYVNGQLTSFSLNFSSAFLEFGNYEICLSASNGACEVLFCDLVSVGTCSTGQENSRWLTYVDGSGINSFSFSAQSTETADVELPYSEGKSTICDADGNLLFTSNCISLRNANLEVTPNGSGLNGGVSAREGSLFVKAPGSQDLYYLFTMDQNENGFGGGLNYHLCDKTLDGGLGDIVEGQKNIFIDDPHTETMTAIRHCNYRDFWLVYYDDNENQYEAWLFTEDGIADSPVVTPFPSDGLGELIFVEDYHVAPKGDMFQHDLNLFSFDAGSGAIDLLYTFPFDVEIRSAWSPSGKYLYMQTGANTPVMRQLDVTLPVDEIVDAHYNFPQAIFAIYSDMEITPNGEIYCSNPFANIIDVIHDPNFYGADQNFEAGAILNTGFTNGLGNYYHAYSVQQVFIEGPDNLCQGEMPTYSIYGCPEGSIVWSVEPEINSVVNLDGDLVASFSDAGEYVIKIALETDCGFMTGELLVTVNSNPTPDLGLDMNICEGTSLQLTPGAGFESYLWNDNSDNSTLTVDEPGTYSVTVTADGCTLSDEITIGEVITPSINLGADTDICETIILLDAGDNFANYVWQDGTTGANYTVFEPGTYWVTATLPCEATDTIVIDNCHTDGILHHSANSLLIYPNPASEVVTISAENFIGAQIELIDAVGRIVWRGRINDTVFNVDVSGYATGLYTVRITGETRISSSVLMLE